MLFALKSPFLWSAVFLSYMSCSLHAQGETCLQQKRCPAQSLKTTEDRYPRLLVFVSFSMPMATLKILHQQVQQQGGKLVFRGLVNNSFKQTALKFKELGVDALIDPTLFRAFKIDKVPAFVRLERSPTFPGEAVPYDVLFGNVSLTYALDQFEQKGEIRP